MLRRLFALLVVAGAAGFGAGLVSSAQTVKAPGAARIPAIPALEASAGTRCPIPQRLRAAFIDASAETDLPLALLTAVAQLESPSRRHADVLEGARYLRSQFERFHSSELALAAYHAEPSVVGDSTTGDTLTYVADVTAVWRALAGCG